MIEKCVQEPCVLLKHTCNTVENHAPHRPDEAPVVADGFDGGKEAEREEKKKKKSFWRWPALRFPYRRATKYNLAKAENKHQAEAGSYQTFTDGTITSICHVLNLG